MMKVKIFYLQIPNRGLLLVKIHIYIDLEKEVKEKHIIIRTSIKELYHKWIIMKSKKKY